MMFLSTSPDVRPLTTAHLAQTMHLLELSTSELAEAVANELASNPALELVDTPRCPNCNRELRGRTRCPACTAADGASDLIVYLTPRDGGHLPGSGLTREEDDEPRDIEAQEQLGEHLLRQIGPELAPDERQIAAYLIARLDENGFLPESPAEAAAYLHAPLATVQRVLRLIQFADPPGMGAANSRESLLVQLDALREDRPVPEIAPRLIAECWQALGRLDYPRIARRLGVPRRQVEEAAQFIARNLTPFPARAFWGSGRGAASTDSAVLHRPDASISRGQNGNADTLIVEVFTPYCGWLRVDPQIKQALHQCADDERAEWDRYVERASLFAKCVPQRNHTMRRLMEAIVRTQRGFILHGDRHLAPMTRAGLARQLGVHESTISRAVAHKAASLPDGRIVPLAKFFDRSLSVRDAVKTIIAREVSPLTDDEIVKRLAEQGIHIARRTVAKYRAAEGILPAPIRGRAQAASRALAVLP